MMCPAVMDRYTCFNNYKCKNLSNCRACRFDKCILVGMNPQGVKFPPSMDVSRLIEYLSQRRLHLLRDFTQHSNSLAETCVVSQDMSDAQLLQYLMLIESKVKRVRETFKYSLPPSTSMTDINISRKFVEWCLT
uniref:Nuclear receptor domain-containing protein n=1 Tax=Ditylenchus dipsaci TaxID=166011 RepID=A0A915CL95_9BILA